ncbi:MAG: ROK family protein [Propioniciclava sp.]|uniref:ROK family protein n=1 Tax=Propioniciclava sp. TaxID=2038686 RepID=UPI0039E2C1A1
MHTIVGIDVGGSFIKWGRADASGAISTFERIPTERENPDGVIEKIATIIRTEPDATRVGISIPGIVSPAGQLVTPGAITGLAGRNVKDEVEALTGLPVAVVNDAHAAGLAERWVGEGADSDHFVCVTLGTGVGGAIFADGKLYRGFRGAAGELSMAPMGPTLPGDAVPQGTAYWCGAVFGLSRIYSQAQGLREPSQWFTDTWEILRRAEAGDAVASASVEEFLDHLSTLFVSLLAVLDPERILIGGGLSEYEGFVARVRTRLQDKIADYPFLVQGYAPDVRACRNGNQAGTLGAIYAASLL